MSETELEDRAYKVYASTTRLCASPRWSTRSRARTRARRSSGCSALVERRRLPILFPLEVRFAAGDDAFLSTAHGRETCYIAVHQYTGMEFESYFRGVEAIMDDYGGRPHWGKRHYQTRSDPAGPLSRLGPLPGGPSARSDPAGVFTNDYARRVLGPVGGNARRQGLVTATGALSAAARLARYEAAFAELDAPFAFVDLDAMWSNSADMLRRARRQADSGRIEVAALPRAAADDPRPRHRLPGSAELHAHRGAVARGRRVRATSSSRTRRPIACALRELAALAAGMPDSSPVLMVDSIEHLDLIEAAVGRVSRAAARVPRLRRFVLARPRASSRSGQTHPDPHARASAGAGDADR